MSYDSYKDTLEHVSNVRYKILTVIEELTYRGINHDATKFLPPEKDAYDEFTESLKHLEYNSPEYKDVLDKMRPAIDHHYQNNSHHPEHYLDGINGMNLFDVIEMLMDWKAAGERHKDRPTDIEKSLQINKDRFGMSDQLYQILSNIWDGHEPVRNQK